MTVGASLPDGDGTPIARNTAQVAPKGGTDAAPLPRLRRRLLPRCFGVANAVLVAGGALFTVGTVGGQLAPVEHE